jgi:riboflavin synthase alpha subunit
LTISDCADILGDAHLGDSISVNGEKEIPRGVSRS